MSDKMWARMSDEAQELWAETRELLDSRTSDGVSRFFLPSDLVDRAFPTAAALASTYSGRKLKFNPDSSSGSPLTAAVLMSILWGAHTFLIQYRKTHPWPLIRLETDPDKVRALERAALYKLSKPPKFPKPEEQSIDYLIHHLRNSRTVQKYKITAPKYKEMLEVGAAWGYLFTQSMVLPDYPKLNSE